MHKPLDQRPPRGRQLEPGQRVRVRQLIWGRGVEWPSEIEGEVVEHVAEQTGSWHAHQAKGRLWLDRLKIRKADGEISSLVVNDHTQVTLLDSPNDGAGK